jgi:hypothetical protein
LLAELERRHEGVWLLLLLLRLQSFDSLLLSLQSLDSLLKHKLLCWKYRNRNEKGALAKVFKRVLVLMST